jgi:hypothetical protein
MVIMTVASIIVFNCCSKAVLSGQQSALDRFASRSDLFHNARCWVLHLSLKMSYG